MIGKFVSIFPTTTTHSIINHNGFKIYSHFSLHASSALSHPRLSSRTNAEETSNETSSRHNGEVKTISALQKFFEKFGYLELKYPIHNDSNTDELDDFVEEGIKTLTTSCYYGAALTLLLYGLKIHDD